jgi:hypothetical protein
MANINSYIGWRYKLTHNFTKIQPKITKLPKLYTDIPLHVLLKFGFHPLPEGVSMRPRSSLQKLTLQRSWSRGCPTHGGLGAVPIHAPELHAKPVISTSMYIEKGMRKLILCLTVIHLTAMLVYLAEVQKLLQVMAK